MKEELDYSYHYQRWYKENPETLRKTDEHYGELLSPFLPENKDVRILDVGCGSGFAMMALKGRGFQHLEGVEINEVQAQLARNKGFNVHLTENTPEFLQKNPDKYDIILCNDVIEHIPTNEQVNFLKAVNTALKQDGLFICSTPNANSTIAGRFRYVDWTHTSGFTETSLDFILHLSGFRNIGIYPSNPFIPQKPWYHSIFFNLSRMFRRIEMIGELGTEGWSIPLSVNIVSVSKK